MQLFIMQVNEIIKIKTESTFLKYSINKSQQSMKIRLGSSDMWMAITLHDNLNDQL